MVSGHDAERVEARRTRVARLRPREQTGGVPVSSYHYLEEPLIAVAALGVIVLLCRWVFSTDHRAPRLAKDPAPRDYGLLQPVCRARTPYAADILRTRLREAGIRCTVAPGTEDVELLVFPDDISRARELVRR